MLAAISVLFANDIRYAFADQATKERMIYAGQLNMLIERKEYDLVNQSIQSYVEAVLLRETGERPYYEDVYEERGRQIVAELKDRRGLSVLDAVRNTPSAATVGVMVRYFEPEEQADFRKHFASVMDQAMTLEEYGIAIEAAYVVAQTQEPIEAEDADILFYLGMLALWVPEEHPWSDTHVYFLDRYLQTAPIEGKYRANAESTAAYIRANGRPS